MNYPKKKKTVTFTIAPQRIKYLGLNLTKKVKDVYIENYKIFIKETEEDKSKWENIPCSWTARTNTIKVSIVPKVIYRLNTIHIKILMVFFTETEKKKILKSTWNCK